MKCLAFIDYPMQKSPVCSLYLFQSFEFDEAEKVVSHLKCAGDCFYAYFN